MKDSDMDSVPDGLDTCPRTADGMAVLINGCPMDSDYDFVPDSLDFCSDTLPGLQVGRDGCPVDNDSDGVKNDDDRCPGTRAGAVVDKRGCVILERKGDKITLDGVNFQFNSAKILPDGIKILEKTAGALLENPKIVIEIGGHTDNIGTAAYNLSLSRRRAASVGDFLASRGVQAARMRITGHGSKKSIRPNDTEAGRAENRRVEIERVSN